MTPQEAIEILKQIRKQKCVTECDYSCKLYESETFCLEEKALDTAIKALEQQPCEDAISRQAVLGLAEQYPLIIGNRYSGLIADIKHLPSVTPSYNSIKTELEQQRWIPVSERLPEDGQDVLICDIDGDIMIGYHVRGRLDTHFSQQGSHEHIKNVKAWLPLPEPYKEDDNANDK